jgi:hypothetical protein
MLAHKLFQKNACSQTFSKKCLLTNFFKKSLIKNANLLGKGLIENPRSDVIKTLLKKGLTANLLRKGLIENGGINFKRLIPKPYRRDQPAQRLRPNGCGATVVFDQKQQS